MISAQVGHHLSQGRVMIGLRLLFLDARSDRGEPGRAGAPNKRIFRLLWSSRERKPFKRRCGTHLATGIAARAPELNRGRISRVILILKGPLAGPLNETKRASDANPELTSNRVPVSKTRWLSTTAACTHCRPLEMGGGLSICWQFFCRAAYRSTPVTCVPGLMVSPALSVALVVPCSILIGFTTFQVPFGNFWNDPHGALPFSAEAGSIPNNINDRSATGTSLSTILHAHFFGLMLRFSPLNRKPKVGCRAPLPASA